MTYYIAIIEYSLPVKYVNASLSWLRPGFKSIATVESVKWWASTKSLKLECPSWSKGADLRPADFDLVGSNPTSSKFLNVPFRNV